MTDYQERRWQSADGLSLYCRDYAPEAAGLPLLCMHGLTRNSGDFADFAALFAGRRRLLAVDVRGRGQSAYDPTYANYHLGTYVQDMIALLDALDLPRVIAVGTSMGGLMAMTLAATRPGVLAGAVINDIGPEIAPEGLARISGYVGKGEPVRSWGQATAAVKLINQRFFPDLDDAAWQRWTRRLFREQADGTLVFDYDPNISRALAEAAPGPDDLWPLFDALAAVPTLVVRGAFSDILAAETVAKMQARRSDLMVAEIPHRGHAPILNEPAAVDAISTFLDRLP